MTYVRFREFLSNRSAPFVIILGANEIASAVAARLTQEGCRVVLSHDPYPPVIRRGMAFHDALFNDHTEVDGVQGYRGETTLEIARILTITGVVAVTSLQLTDLMALRTPDILIDARMQKRCMTPHLRNIATLSIGLGPQFAAGVNCDVAIETHPDHTGELVESGETRPNDHIPRYLGGVGRDRFVYSARAGVWRTPLDIGARIFKDYLIGLVDGHRVVAPMDGFLRGIARDGVVVPQNVKLIEVDPRGRASSWTGTDERGRAIADAVYRVIAKAPLICWALPDAETTYH
ncbi:MAG: xanthine dehydrogenase [Hyphomicrobiales bacterium]|nr:MAG: xanthine dehydrogenase [Hyphomicrobiales bacterium]